MNIPYIEHGGSGAPLHFLHANGYPPACYNPLLDRLKSQYRVFGMLLRPLWPDSKPEEIQDWNSLSGDLLKFLDEQKTGSVIGVGHSIGAIVTLRAALRQPERFRALILLDPVLFPPYFIMTWNLARWLGFGHRIHPLISGALKRRRTFDNLDMIFRGYRKREIFRYFNDDNLRAFIAGMVRPKADGGYELAYSPEWESRIYYTGVWRDMELWRGLPKLKVPTLIIRGAETDTFWEKTGKLVQRKQAKARPERSRRIRVEVLPQSTHLLPLERPQEVFEIMQSFLKESR